MIACVHLHSARKFSTHDPTIIHPNNVKIQPPVQVEKRREFDN